MIESAKKEVFGHFLEFGLLDRVGIAYFLSLLNILNIGLIPYCFKIGLNPYCLPSVFSSEFILVDCQFSTFPFGYCLTLEG